MDYQELVDIRNWIEAADEVTNELIAQFAKATKVADSNILAMGEHAPRNIMFFNLPAFIGDDEALSVFSKALVSTCRSSSGYGAELSRRANGPLYVPTSVLNDIFEARGGHMSRAAKLRFDHIISHWFTGYRNGKEVLHPQGGSGEVLVKVSDVEALVMSAYPKKGREYLNGFGSGSLIPTWNR